jgi:periplasmic protein TonB
MREEASAEVSGTSKSLRVLILAVVLAIVGAAVWWLIGFLTKPSGLDKPRAQQVAILRQPPPPPPKPPEKPPEPPKVKEEVKIDPPQPTPQPQDPKPAADDKPASDKPLGVDAAGGPGSDGFGLAGNRGGRDLLSTGGGGGAYYTGLLQRHFFDALSRNRRILKDEFRVVVRIWVADDGRVQRADIVNGSGNAQVDEAIQVTLMEMAPLREVPPASMRPIQLRLSNRA